MAHRLDAYSNRWRGRGQNNIGYKSATCDDLNAFYISSKIKMNRHKKQEMSDKTTALLQCVSYFNKQNNMTMGTKIIMAIIKAVATTLISN